MEVRRVRFLASAGWPPVYPDHPWAEIAVAGRSNVGKSSLLNVLVGQKRVARVSSAPGRTQLLNFFAVEERLVLVDLPGFGYAKVSHAVQAGWARMMDHYFYKRKALRGLVLVLDIRREPGTEEQDLFEICRQRGLAVLPVATKSDKLSKSQRQPQLARLAATFGLRTVDVTPFSSLTKEGRDPLWTRLEKVAGLFAHRADDHPQPDELAKPHGPTE